MTGLTVRIPTSYPPECPICRRELSTVCVEFVDGVAFCRECRCHAEKLALSVEVDVCRCVGVDSGYRECGGLRVWAPGPLAERSCTAAQHLISTGRCSAPIADYVQQWAGQVRESWGKALDVDPDDQPSLPTNRTTPSCLVDAQRHLFATDPISTTRDVHA